MSNLSELLSLRAKQEWAEEDLKILDENKGMAITGTKHGCLHCSLDEYEGQKVYSITYGMGKHLFQTPDRCQAKLFIMDAYSVENE